ncbi:nef-associated protein 1 [Phtheirospermum japonicum]|uniref:Nef-associated protein 1 n=1 Tax=Phtheirospermum japonicum TaxID=374723 RepID=A0A830C0V4_9LAMI|nr:nef-associated protein 1 [Phtheirospermum japonicum]
MAGPKSQWPSLSVTLAFVSLSATTVISRESQFTRLFEFLYLHLFSIKIHIISYINTYRNTCVHCLCDAAVYSWSRKSKSKSVSINGEASKKIEELEASLKDALENCAAERKGRIRAQQALRETLRKPSDKIESTSYPMAPIAVVHSCFSTRNGTPRQPLLVPLAKASLICDPTRVPQASLEGLEGYSHCWIIYVFHLNTDLDKLWKQPSQSKIKAKVRVPSLNGERIGVFATRSPHRPCPIGLTVAKVEAVHGNTVLLSGVDLVDGTPVLDIKPYLPYCDNIQGATVPDWVKVDNVLAVASVNFSEGFSSSLADCWSPVEKKSLYPCPDEFQSLIRQVLSWDIRSMSQRSRPHQPSGRTEAQTRSDNDVGKLLNDSWRAEKSCQEDGALENGGELVSSSLASDVVYHLILEGLDVSYRIDSDSNVLVECVTVA